MSPCRGDVPPRTSCLHAQFGDEVVTPVTSTPTERGQARDHSGQLVERAGTTDQRSAQGLAVMVGGPAKEVGIRLDHRRSPSTSTNTSSLPSPRTHVAVTVDWASVTS